MSSSAVMRMGLATLACGAVLPGVAHADAVQDRIVASARGVPQTAFAFTQTTRIARPGAAAKTFVQRYDPAQPQGRRWALVSIDGRAPTAKEAASAVKSANAGPVPSYGRLGLWFGTTATRVATSATTATYRFAALPKGVVMIGKHDASADTAAEAVVNLSGATPFVEHVRYSSTAGFRMALVLKVERYIFDERFRPAADGRPVPSSTTGEMAGAMLGKSGTLTTTTTYSDVRAMR